MKNLKFLLPQINVETEELLHTVSTSSKFVTNVKWHPKSTALVFVNEEKDRDGRFEPTMMFRLHALIRILCRSGLLSVLT